MPIKLIPPRKPSELVWIVYYDHEKEITVYEGDPPGELAINWAIGWIRVETEQHIELGHDLSTTKEVDCKRISKADIIARVPVLRKKRPNGYKT